jgi:hypothetical protein
MRIYKFIKTIPYHTDHPRAIYVERRVLFADQNGIEHPTCPCVIINGHKVMLPSHEVWNLGGNMSPWMYMDQIHNILPNYGLDTDFFKLVVLMIWRTYID